MINGFNAIPYYCTWLLNTGLNAELKYRDMPKLQ